MKNIMKKIQPYVLALGIGSAALTGCGPRATIYPPMEKVREVLGRRAYGAYHHLEGYVVPAEAYHLVQATAVIYAGNVKLKETEDEIRITGSYRVSENREVLERVLENMDKDNNRIITPEEAWMGFNEALEDCIRRLKE